MQDEEFACNIPTTQHPSKARLSSSKGLGLSFEQHLLIDFDYLAMVVLLMSTVALQY
jgi:hypothetical protein